MPDLADAFAQLDCQDAWLLVVGPDEERMQDEMQARIGASRDRCRFVGYTDRPEDYICLLYTSPSPRDRTRSRMPSSA